MSLFSVRWLDTRKAPMPILDADRRQAAPPTLGPAIPILFVRDVASGAEFFREKLGFEIDFLHGAPPFYGSVSRDGACLHLRFVHEAVFHLAAAREESLICASIETDDVQALYEEFVGRGAPVAQSPTKQAWGGTDLHIPDPDGNVIAFVTYT
jgi:catechol 2,3-dioxygenase-like lactoylglutathione lyase family enzyme